MKVNFLGTNGWYDTSAANTVCTLVDAGDDAIVLDAGFGLHKLDGFVRDGQRVCMFLSHFHLDHIIGLHTLPKFDFPRGLDIYGQEGMAAVLATFLNEPFTATPSMSGYPIRMHEVTEGAYDEPFRFECRFLVHASPCLGYRFELGGKVIAYCTDTGYCDNIVYLARDADLLIIECSLYPGEETPGWPHMNPETAARIAVDAGVARLALTHFDACRYPRIEDRQKPEDAAKKIFPDTIAAYDGLELEF